MTASVLLLIACVEPPDESVYGDASPPGQAEELPSESQEDAVAEDTEVVDAHQPALELDTEWLDFGELTAGDAMVLEVTLTNLGDEPVQVMEVSLPSGPWSGPKALPWTIYPEGEQAFRIGYEPEEAGEHGGVVEFVTDHPEVPTYEVAVEGTAIAACEICAPRLEATRLSDFVSLLGWEHSQMLTLENTGDQLLTIYDVYVYNDASGGDFWVDWAGEHHLQPGDFLQVEVGYQSDIVAYDAADTARDENVLHVLSNDPDQEDLQIGLYGIGAT